MGWQEIIIKGLIISKYFIYMCGNTNINNFKEWGTNKLFIICEVEIGCWRIV